MAKVEFSSETDGAKIKKIAEGGKILGFPFPLNTSYREIMDALGPPDDQGMYGEGSYNLIYGNFNLFFNYEHFFDEENINLDSPVLQINQNFKNNVSVSTFIEQVGSPADMYFNDAEESYNLLYQFGDFEITVETIGDETEDFNDNLIMSLWIKEKSDYANSINPRFSFQLTGTDGKEYDLNIYSDNETTETIDEDDVWYMDLIGQSMYYGEYSVALKESNTDKYKIQEGILGGHTFVLQDETSTASIVYANEGPDLLLTTSKESFSYSRYTAYMVLDGELKEIPFISGGDQSELYAEGIRNISSTMWETLSFSNASDTQWMGNIWEFDEKKGIFQFVRNKTYATRPW